MLRQVLQAWTTRPNWPANSVASADLLNNVNQPGLYFTLIRGSTALSRNL
ncbi:MAG TPA: hypothetical protein VHT52_00045 [Stellaceae bacterium]|nr:hypothetical protein [Stellaceae bacterium]